MSKHHPTKQELLEHYAQDNKHPHRFFQIDAFIDRPFANPGDLMEADAQGDVINSGLTWELRTACPNVRVHIPVNANPKTAIRQLQKAIELIEKRPELVSETYWDRPKPLFGRAIRRPVSHLKLVPLMDGGSDDE